MSVSTIEAYVENGQIRVPDDVKLPEKAKVYIVIPGVTEVPKAAHIYSPRLAHRERAEHFKMEIIEGAR
ncbi:MAG TPA: hypothetical protein VHM90_22040 [Phycisphaerae bacterium]|nr:hypothetical protein [Phycisphaerae bacterium]